MMIDLEMGRRNNDDDGSPLIGKLKDNRFGVI